MTLESCLFTARVHHRRSQPKMYAFTHNVLYLWINLDDIAKLANLKLLSFNKKNIFSLNWQNYAFSSEERHDMREYVLSHLEAAGFPQHKIKRIALLTLPQILGYVFNPVSFWLCFDAYERLIAVLAEVNNTFGGRHCYSCFRNDFAEISVNDTLEQRKVHHVSPFCQVEGYYRFKFGINSENIYVGIDYFNDADDKILITTIHAKKKTLNDRNLLYFFIIYPFMTIKVITLIHYHALRLWLKGIPFFGKNPPPPINKRS